MKRLNLNIDILDLRSVLSLKLRQRGQIDLLITLPECIPDDLSRQELF